MTIVNEHMRARKAEEILVVIHEAIERQDSKLALQPSVWRYMSKLSGITYPASEDDR